MQNDGVGVHAYAARVPETGSTSKIPSSSNDLLHTGQAALTRNHFLRKMWMQPIVLVFIKEFKKGGER